MGQVSAVENLEALGSTLVMDCRARRSAQMLRTRERNDRVIEPSEIVEGGLR